LEHEGDTDLNRGIPLCFVLAFAIPLHSQEDQHILGLASRPDIFLSEGVTDAAAHPKATGMLRAIMLFARFPDGEEDKTPQQLYDHLAPGAAAYFKASSYGQLDLHIEARYQWYPMKGKSTDAGYDCSRHESHKSYVAEVIAAADADVDFSKYTIVYVVATKNKGTPNSPTLHCGKKDGILADGNEIRHAVTFGNDCRGKNWGWQTLVHETGHILGLPDLYNLAPAQRDYKCIQQFVGCWDPMGHQGHGSDLLAWHKRKLLWLDDQHFVIVKEGMVTEEIVHISTDQGVKALVIPISEHEAYVAEVKHLDAARNQVGVLIYRVATDVPSGRGPIRVVPAVADDDKNNPALAREYVAHYHALYSEAGHFEDKTNKVRIDVLKKTERGFQIKATR
jgi:M6 family metalloprotease-like protein